MLKRFVRWLSVSVAAVVIVAAGGYAVYVNDAYRQYGHPEPVPLQDYDELLQQFMPVYDVVERHHVEVAAPPSAVFAAAADQDLFAVPAVRTIFRAREVLLRATPSQAGGPRGLLASTQAMGWVVLASRPGGEVVMGAVTKPWEANVTFRGIPPEQFLAFNEPGYVKIVWTLRADPLGASTSIFRTETRAVATDNVAREKFRRYWSFLSPGIVLIRRFSAAQLQADTARMVMPPRAALPNFESAIQRR